MTAPYLTCKRCGAELYPLADLVILAKQISDRAEGGLRALDRMRLALPSSVGTSLSEARLDGRILARRLECHAGLCASNRPSMPRNGPLASDLQRTDPA